MLEHILDTPSDNLVLRPGDELFVSHDPRTFLVLGATLKVSQYEFDARTVTLAEAVARAGGPNDALADIGQLYLLRAEDPGTVRRLLALQNVADANVPAQVSVAYRLNLRQGAGYFVGRHVAMRNKDVVLLTNASTVQLQKMFAVLRNVTGIYRDFHSRY